MSSLQKILAEKLDTEKLRGNSFFVLSPDNSWRQLAYYLSYHQYTVSVMYVLIVVNAATMAIITPLDDPDSWGTRVVKIADLVVLSIFTVEMIVKMAALGAFFGSYSYWQSSGWYRLDFLVIVGSIIGVIVGERGFAAFRAFRAFRIFRAVKYFKGFRDVMASLKSGLSLVADNSAFMGFFFLVFGVFSVDIFQESLSRWCVTEEAFARGFIEEPMVPRACGYEDKSLSELKIVQGNCPDGFLCMRFSSQKYKNGKANFDDIFHACIVIWQISTLSTWTQHIYHLQESEGETLPALYGFVLIFFLNFIVINLFVAVVGEVFGRVRDTDLTEHPSLYCLQYDQVQAWEVTKQRRLMQTVHWGLVRDDVRQLCEVWGEDDDDKLLTSRSEVKTSDFEVLRHKMVPFMHSRKFLLIVVGISVTNVALKAMNRADTTPVQAEFQETIDYLFTVLLFLELGLRFVITANGSPKRFFNSVWDTYDFCVLLVSIVTLIFTGASLSFVRLRVLQLAFYYEGLRPVAELCNKSVRGIPGAISIIMFIFFSFFVFGVAGVQFFAGKMIDETTGERMRVHFDHFVSGQLLLFHVMSGDTWEDYMRTTWHNGGATGVLFIVIFFVYSVWVLLNLFTAVVLETFQLDDETRLKEQIKVNRHTRMVGEKKKLAIGSTRRQLLLKFKLWVQNFVALPECKRLVHNADILEDNLALELNQILEKGTRTNLESLLKDITIMNLEAPSMTQDLDQEHISHGQGETSDLEWNTTLDMLRAKQVTVEKLINNNFAHRKLCNEIDEAMDEFSPEEKITMNLPMSVLINEEGVEDTTEWFTTECEYSYCCLHYQGHIRVALKNFTKTQAYEYVMTLFILASTVTLVLEPPSEATWELENAVTNGDLYKTLRILDWFWLGAFGQEVVLKSIAQGLITSPWSGKVAYLSNGWNVLDMFLLVSMCVTTAMPQFKAVQAFRTLRPIRVLHRIESLHVVVSAIWSALGATFSVVLGFAYWFILLGSLGVSMFAGKFSYCNDASTGTRLSCVGDWADPQREGVLTPRVWLTHTQNFDTIGNAMQTLVEVTSLSSWSVPMFNAMDITGRDQQPVFMNSPMNCIYFIVTVIICSFYFVNIFVAVILDKIYQQMGISIMTRSQRAWVDFQKTVRLFDSQMHGAKAPSAKSSSIRLILYHIVMHKFFDSMIILVVTINIGFMSSAHAAQPVYWTELLEFLDLFFSTIYFVEMVVKIIAYGGVREYVKNRWNVFDATIVFGSVVGFIMKQAGATGVAAISTVRMLRIARIFRLMTTASGIKYLFKTLLMSLPAILNIALLCFILIVIYTVFGKTVFGNIRFGAASGLSEHANFRSTLTGLGTVFRVLTLDNWHYILHDSVRQPPFCTQTEEGDKWHDDCGSVQIARAYYLTFYIVGVYIFINLILAVILDNFGHIFSEHSFCLAEGDVTALDEEWSRVDVACSGELPRYKVCQIFERLFHVHQPLGCSITSSRHADRQRYAFMMYALQGVSIEIRNGISRPAPAVAEEGLGLIVVKWRDVMTIATLTYVRFYFPECLKLSQYDLWMNEKRSIELTLALRKIGALIQSYLVQKNLEVKYGSKSFLLKKIKEFLNWRKACDTAQAKGKKPPPPPTQKYAALRAKMLEKVKKEELQASSSDNKSEMKTINERRSQQLKDESVLQGTLYKARRSIMQAPPVDLLVPSNMGGRTPSLVSPANSNQGDLIVPDLTVQPGSPQTHPLQRGSKKSAFDN